MKNVAMVLAKNFEDVEATDPMDYLQERGVEVTVIGLNKDVIEGKKGAKITPTTTFEEITPEQFEQFDMMLIPGGGSPENLRIHEEAVDFARRFTQSGRPVASICHGPQLLISSKVLDGRTLTSVNKIRDDVINAGGNYVDQEVVIDDNLITSRTPADLPAFNQAMGKALGVESGAKQMATSGARS
jgi:protease I